MKQHSSLDELPSAQSKNRLQISINSRNWFSHLKVGQKISIGYGLLVSVSVLATTIGYVIAEHYQQQAQKQEEAVIHELYSVHNLKTSVFRIRTKQHKLILYKNQPEIWQEKYTELVKYITQARQVWSEFRAQHSVENHPKYYSANQHKAIQRLLETHKDFSVYLQHTETLLQENNISQLSARKIEAAHNQLFHFMHSSSVFMIDDFLDDITNLVEVTGQEYQQIQPDLQTAEKLHLYVIVGSLLLSFAIAILLAIYTSHTIARPIQALTHVAQQVTEESNFDLQAPVTTNDEIGILATYLNRLIQEVQQLIKIQQDANEQLEVYNQVLEEKVCERTQQLNEKNRSLELALEELRRTQAQLLESQQNLK
ncbi:HAMP domain-containing protein [Nostoc sp. CHAB 5836]|uniref:HAMP domain-containing protein n=1 Tax=Nostoc sp. CHAB 5836 TaxID=2780404 RepID=UPI001E503987|nr:HAMP domain-containing protein [Nostoc sp. CHAB 5836]MCC5614043.1 HAMP domain-containing protein [Nostoc sp. CHAB 5836]